MCTQALRIPSCNTMQGEGGIPRPRIARDRSFARSLEEATLSTLWFQTFSLQNKRKTLGTKASQGSLL